MRSHVPYKITIFTQPPKHTKNSPIPQNSIRQYLKHLFIKMFPRLYYKFDIYIFYTISEFYPSRNINS